MSHTITALRTVYASWRYWVISLIVFASIVSISLLFANRDLISLVFGSSVGIQTKLAFIVSLFGTIYSNNSVLSAVLLVLFAVCTVIQVSLLVFYVRRARAGFAGSASVPLSGFAGIIASVLGLGCAACGSVALLGILSLFGAGGLLALLPLHGTEFLLAGIVLIVISIRYLAKKINDPLVCSIT